MLIVEGSTGVGKALDDLVDNEIDVTAYTETIGIVILGRTEVQEVFAAVVIDVRVEVSTCTRRSCLS